MSVRKIKIVNRWNYKNQRRKKEEKISKAEDRERWR